MIPTIFHLSIRGVVQGVGYRWALVQAARRFRVDGWVRNRHDGSVEAMVSGSRDAVDNIVAWAHRGPPSAAVSGVDVLPGEGVFDSFEQRPTA